MSEYLSGHVRLGEDLTSVVILDQTLLPNEVKYLTLRTPEEMFEAIRLLRVRGAPAIGICAGYCLAALAEQRKALPPDQFRAQLHQLSQYLNSSRPTAVNLSWALTRLGRLAHSMPHADPPAIADALVEEAIAIHKEDIAMCRAISEHGLGLIKDGDGLIVDGGEGVVVLSPDARTRSEYLAKQKDYQEKTAALEVYRDKPTADADGKYYHLYANIGSAAEAEAAAQSGAEGIGLFRTEFLFMDRTSLPDETVQYEAYYAVSKTMAGKEVIIRTLDVGGDKAIDYLGLEKEENPFLGHRAIRYCLDRPELYKVQLRALLRAGAEEQNIKIMLPLVTCVEEVRAARELLDQCKKELAEAGVPYDKDIALGAMIETPAAALIADLLAQECDFFSIGTNDLTQYTMAVDRGNAKVEKLYSPFQPAVLRSIRNVISAAKRAGIPVGMCGEAAADPGLIPLLMCWGLDEFSVSSASVLATRAQIHRWHEKDFRRVTEEALGLSTASGVEGYLKATVNK